MFKRVLRPDPDVILGFVVKPYDFTFNLNDIIDENMLDPVLVMAGIFDLVERCDMRANLAFQSSFFFHLAQQSLVQAFVSFDLAADYGIAVAPLVSLNQ